MRGARETALVLGFLALCPLAALLIGTDTAAPLERARMLVELEQALGVFVEPGVHAWVADRPALADAAGVFYIWAHVPVAGWALVWTWFVRPEVFRQVRDLFLWTQGLTVAVWLLLPVAPPRLLGEHGFTDTLAGQWGSELADSAHLLQSPFAALPSGHVAFALCAGLTFARHGDQAWLRVFGLVYPPVVVAVTIATANHFVLDALAAAAVVALAAKLVTFRPWQTSKRTSPAPCGRSSVRWETRSRRATRS